ncbi:MAG: imelysin family protein [Pseudomonadota bacterium]
MIDRAVDEHVLPRVTAAAEAAAALAETAEADCAPDSEALRAAYHAGFDAWIAASHLQFGPALEDNRGFAMGFWPDPRGAGRRAIAGLISAENPIGLDPAGYAEVSVAARGYHALEAMLFNEEVAGSGTPEYRCALVRTMASDTAATAAAIRDGWLGGHADAMRSAGAAGNAAYPGEAVALRALFGAASTGLQFTSDTRLARPLGTFERAYPLRAEARRSERSLRHVALSADSAGELALILAGPAGAEVEDEIQRHRDRIAALIERLDDPTLAGVATPQGRIRVEAVRAQVDGLRRTLALDVAPVLGVAAGFNALDGD